MFSFAQLCLWFGLFFLHGGRFVMFWCGAGLLLMSDLVFSDAVRCSVSISMCVLHVVIRFRLIICCFVPLMFRYVC